MAGLSGLALTGTTVAAVGPQPLVLLTTGSFVTVYALGTAAAPRLLPRGTLPHPPHVSRLSRSRYSSP